MRPCGPSSCICQSDRRRRIALKIHDTAVMEDEESNCCRPTVEPGGASAGLFEDACRQLIDMTQARCAAVVVIDGENGSGYSVVGPLEDQVMLPDILEQMASALRRQLARSMQ